ncbi:MAG: hypothetical protein JOZ83_05725 [Silvibacterium sp.]|nr:hypothetical protein [Silvibacterium sp.]
MRRFSGISLFFAAIVPFVAAANGAAVPCDQKLLSLVPPGAELVTGIIPFETNVPRGWIFLSSGYTKLDYDDYFSLVGVDSSRQLSYMILTDFPGKEGQHSLLASGHFDQARIYKSATDGGAKTTEYRGISVVLIEPFLREREAFHETRWLAIADSRFVFFGSSEAVQQELDRYLDHSTPDPFLAQRIAHLRHSDSTWALLYAPGRSSIVRDSLTEVGLDPTLAAMPDAGGFQLGVHYGNVIEIEYEITAADELAYSQPASLTPAAALSMNPPASRQAISAGERRFHGVLKIPASRYGTWFDELAAQWRARNSTAH